MIVYWHDTEGTYLDDNYKQKRILRRGYWYDLCELTSELIIPRYTTFEISGDWDEDVRAYNGESDDNIVSECRWCMGEIYVGQEMIDDTDDRGGIDNYHVRPCDCECIDTFIEEGTWKMAYDMGQGYLAGFESDRRALDFFPIRGVTQCSSHPPY